MKKTLKNVDGGIWIPYRLLFGLDMQFNAFMGTYMLIYSYTHNNDSDWLEGGADFIKSKLNAKSSNTIKTAIAKLLESGLIVSRVRATIRGKYTDYRINEQFLNDMGIFDNEEDVIPDEPNFIHDMSKMNFPEPEFEYEFKSAPEFEPEPIQIYGEYQNVRLTESEYKKLDEQFGTVFTDITLKRFSEYVFTTNKYTTANFRSHTDVLKKWCGEDKIKAEKSAEKKFEKNLSRNLSETDTSNRYNKTIYKDYNNSLSQSVPNEKNEYSDKMNFTDVLKKMGSVFANGNAKSENDFQNFDCIARQTEKCSISVEFVGKPRAMKSALKFMFADSYNRKNSRYSEELEGSANGFIGSLAELASADFTIIKKQKVYGVDVVEKINRMFSDSCQFPSVILENFMRFYAKKANSTTVHSAKAFMKAIWWEFLDNEVREAHYLSELYYPAETDNEYSWNML